MRSDIVPGGIFPNYELPDHTGTLRKLSELQGDDPLILTLSRGHYCPKEHQQHLELAAFHPKIAVAYTQIAPKIGDRWTTPEPVAVIDAVNHEARLEHERMRDHRMVLGVSVLLDVEILLNRSVGVRKKCPLGSD